MNQEVYSWSLARIFYLALPRFFGEDLQSDFAVIEKLGRFLESDLGNRPGWKSGRPFVDAFDEIFLGVGKFFQGSGAVHYQSEELGRVVWEKTGALDGGLAVAFSTNYKPDFLEKREAFFSADPERSAAENRYRTAAEGLVSCGAGDGMREARLRKEAVGEGIWLVLQAAKERFAGADNKAGILVSGKLEHLLDKCRGSCARQLTPRNVYKSLEDVADRCVQMSRSLEISQDRAPA